MCIFHVNVNLRGYETRVLATLPLFYSLNKTESIICIETRKKKKRMPSRGTFWTGTLSHADLRATLYEKQEQLALHAGEHIHPFDASAREGEEESGRAWPNCRRCYYCVTMLRKRICIPTGLYFFDIEPRPNVVARSGREIALHFWGSPSIVVTSLLI